MKFFKSDALTLNSIQHMNAHVSYLLTCDSKANDDRRGLAESNIIAYYKDDKLYVENGYSLNKRTSLAKYIRKIAKESLNSITDKEVKAKLRMELAYLEGLTQLNLDNESFQEMANCVFEYIQDMENDVGELGQETFLYVFHLHQNQCPHIHRFFKVK